MLFQHVFCKKCLPSTCESSFYDLELYTNLVRLRDFIEPTLNTIPYIFTLFPLFSFYLNRCMYMVRISIVGIFRFGIFSKIMSSHEMIMNKKTVVRVQASTEAIIPHPKRK